MIHVVSNAHLRGRVHDQNDVAHASTRQSGAALLAARAEGVGGVITTVLRYEADKLAELLGVPTGEGWTMTAMLALGYPLGRWGVAANRWPVHEVSSRNRWKQPFGPEVPDPLWAPAAGRDR
jgi:nitroreductase